MGGGGKNLHWRWRKSSFCGRWGRKHLHGRWGQTPSQGDGGKYLPGAWRRGKALPGSGAVAVRAAGGAGSAALSSLLVPSPGPLPWRFVGAGKGTLSPGLPLSSSSSSLDPSPASPGTHRGSFPLSLPQTKEPNKAVPHFLPSVTPGELPALFQFCPCPTCSTLSPQQVPAGAE